MHRTGSILALLGTGLLAGGMLFFSAVMAPLVFTRLPMDVAGPFIRTAFPFLYAYCLATSGVALLGYALRRSPAALVPGVIMLCTLWSWLWMLPRLDALRVAGNHAAFARGHFLSTWVFGLELALALWRLGHEGIKRHSQSQAG
ncbi:MAG: DUF4149 domain-containing protein [Rhodospirillales bacterium]|nr:DUF4149 domain-containing protein [Rhodospirillales bacterium]